MSVFSLLTEKMLQELQKLTKIKEPAREVEGTELGT